MGRDIIDKKVGDETVSDVALRAANDGKQTYWEPAKVRLARRSLMRRRPSYRLVDVGELPALFNSVAGAEMAAEAARLRDMHPSDVAGVVRALPLAQRKQLAEAMDDERLADLLEELPEAEQLRIIEGLDIERLVNVLEEMEYDDLADLLAEMPGEQRTRVLDAMDEEDADVMRRLLSYEEGTAGSLMTPDIIIMGPTATVAEALAEIRDPEWLVSIAAQVFVVQPPYKPPTGTYLGVVHFQRLLREPPSHGARPLRRSKSPPSRPTSSSARWPNGWPATTCCRSACATKPGTCSARSRSTTCSTARCPPAGGNAGG